MFIKLTGIFVIIIAIISGWFYWYFNYSQTVIQQLATDKAKLELSIQSQQDAINSLQLNAVRQATQINQLQTDLTTANTYRAKLEKLLSEHDLTALARAKPKLIEDRMNAATIRVFNDLESMTNTTPNPTNKTSTFKNMSDVNAQPLK